jgi:hypothetical protein
MQDEAEPIVVNTGPLIALGSCGQIELLRCFHSRVIVPEAVVTELCRGIEFLVPLPHGPILPVAGLCTPGGTELDFAGLG